MDLKTILKQSYIVLFLRLCGQKWQEMVFCLKYMATGHMGKSEKKLMTNLTIQAHALEKGMSIGHVRTGFGKKKAISLLKGLENLVSVSTMNRKGYITEIVSIIYQYIRFNNGLGANMEDIELRLKRFCSVHHIRPLDQGGIIRKRLTDTQQMLESDFRLFSQTRFSVRDFGTTPISIEAIKNALKLCERTPSACNRQKTRLTT